LTRIWKDDVDEGVKEGACWTFHKCGYENLVEAKEESRLRNDTIGLGTRWEGASNARLTKDPNDMFWSSQEEEQGFDLS
jgi:hypothetical protein